MIKVFTKEADGKIHLTTEELQSLLDESYWEGYKANGGSWVYHTPNWYPYTLTCNKDSITLSSSDLNPYGCTIQTSDSVSQPTIATSL